MPPIDPLWCVVFCLSAALLGLVLGYGVARRLFRAPVAGSSPALASPSLAGVPAAVPGWTQVERRLTAWFADFMGARSRTPTEECRAVAKRLGLEEPPR